MTTNRVGESSMATSWSSCRTYWTGRRWPNCSVPVGRTSRAWSPSVGFRSFASAGSSASIRAPSADGSRSRRPERVTSRRSQRYRGSQETHRFDARVTLAAGGSARLTPAMAAVTEEGRNEHPPTDDTTLWHHVGRPLVRSETAGEDLLNEARAARTGTPRTTGPGSASGPSGGGAQWRRATELRTPRSSTRRSSVATSSRPSELCRSRRAGRPPPDQPSARRPRRMAGRPLGLP
jgi:hypothetical protein